MRILICDVESTCFRISGVSYSGTSEIIEIGACIIDNDINIVSEFDRFIRPVKHPILSSFCKELTSIKQSDVDGAETFPVMIEEFKKYISDNGILVWSSWGNYDFNVMLYDCYRYGVIFPFLQHLNLKVEVGELGKTRHHGVESTILELGLKFDGTHHRGIDDVRNVVRILRTLKIKPDDILKYCMSKSIESKI